MPYKDKAKNSQVSSESAKRLYYPPIHILMRRNFPEAWEALEKAVADQNITKTEYARNSVIEQLIRDGYLPAPEE